MYEFVEGASKGGSKGALYYWKKLRKKPKTKTQAIHKQ